MSSTIGPARPASLRRSVSSIETMTPFFGDQRRHALRQKPIEDLHLLDPEVGGSVIVDRHAARQPAIGGVALGKPLQFARRPHAFDRRVKPQRKQNRGIGRRPSLRPRAREPDRKA
jgi:hypothetical protein